MRKRRGAVISNYVPIRTTKDLNDELNRIHYTGDLQRLYRHHLRNINLDISSKPFSEVLHCSDTSNFVVKYLSLSRIKEGSEEQRKFKIEVNSAGRILYPFNQPAGALTHTEAVTRWLARRNGRPCVAVMSCLQKSHVITLANTGEGWCMYQSNIGKYNWITNIGEGYLISDRLNAVRGITPKQRINMTDAGLHDFFDQLTSNDNCRTLFFGATGLTHWDMMAFTLDGSGIDLLG